MARAWYRYFGPTTSLTGALNSVNYSYVSFYPSGCDGGTDVICSVSGLYNDITYGDHPAPFGSKLRSYITAAIASASAKPSLTGQKRYTYEHLNEFLH